MPTFDTPEPIRVSVELSVGDIRVVASARGDTTVDVRPRDPASKGDIAAARQTRVEFVDGRLSIKAPKGWRHFAPGRGHDSIDVEIELPVGSELRGEAAIAALHGTGRLGACQFKISAGNIDLADTGPAQLRTSAGDITVGRIAGDAELTTSSGALRVDRVDGTALVKNSNGATRIGEITGELRVSAANGNIVIQRAGGTVVAKTANGDVLIGEVVKGAVQVDTARGRIDIGVAEGVAAWLDLTTSFGNVGNRLDAAARPDGDEATVEVRARTAFGDITISRAIASDATSRP